MFLYRVTLISVLMSLCFAEDILNVMFISSGGGQYNSSGAEPAVDLAVEIINENHVIPGYQLNIASRGDSSCDRKQALSTFLDDVTFGVDKIAVIGCGCSIATEPVAEISFFWNITHLSYASSVDTLSNQQRFPNFFRTHTSESNLAISIISIMEKFGWKKLKIITQEESLFVQSSLTLMDMLQERNISIDMNGRNSFVASENIRDIKGFYQPDVRIYFLNMYSIHARRLLCKAASLRNATDPAFYVSGYVWITLGWYRDNWWTKSVAQDENSGCSDAVLEPLIRQTLEIQQTNTARDRNAPTDVNLTAQEFKNRYTAALLSNGFDFEPTAYYAYDAIWALAFAINRSIPYFSIEQIISLGNFSYATGKAVSEVIQRQMRNSTFEFEGVSGNVQLDENGTRRGDDPQILKYRNIDSGQTERVLVATITNETLFNYINNETSETVWPDGIPPDGSPYTVVIAVKLPITIIYHTLTTIGIIFAFVCLLFNITFRKRKIVRLISPNLNYVIIIGGIMLYASVYFYTLPSADKFLVTLSCHIRLWLQFLGYYLCFGTIVVKIWRVYYIFHNPSAKKKSRIPKDWHLFLIVMAVCSVASVLLIGVAIFGNYGAEEVSDNETADSRDATTQVIITYSNYICEGKLSFIWIFICYGSIGLTQLVAVIFAFRTRKVTIKALNDSKYLTVMIYISSIIFTAMIIGVLALSNFLNADSAVFGALLMLFVTVVLGFTFIPKMVILYKDPKGEKIFEHGKSQGTLNVTSDDTKIEQYNDLEKYCIELEGRLRKHEDFVPYRKLTRSSSLQKHSSITLLSSNNMHSVNPINSFHTTSVEVEQSCKNELGEKKLNSATIGDKIDGTGGSKID